MVILHSYVKLPEGKLDPRKTGDPAGFTDLESCQELQWLHLGPKEATVAVTTDHSHRRPQRGDQGPGAEFSIGRCLKMEYPQNPVVSCWYSNVICTIPHSSPFLWVGFQPSKMGGLLLLYPHYHNFPYEIAIFGGIPLYFSVNIASSYCQLTPQNLR